MLVMEQLVVDIEAFAAEFGITPQKVLRDAVNAEWDRWAKWKAGTASATLATVGRIHVHMAECRRKKIADTKEDAA